MRVELGSGSGAHELHEGVELIHAARASLIVGGASDPESEGERPDDLRDFDASEFVEAMLGQSSSSTDAAA